LADHGIGMTDLVKRATARAAELAVDEYAAGLGRVDRLAAWLTPAVVCVIGLDGWRKVVDRKSGAGWHARGVGGQPVYVMPNPSGLNAHVNVAGLAVHLRTAAAGPDA
jgi:TDG/mug DNA glycosylase family protein